MFTPNRFSRNGGLKLVMVIIRFRVQFVINLHEWVFQKAKLSGECNFS